MGAYGGVQSDLGKQCGERTRAEEKPDAPRELDTHAPLTGVMRMRDEGHNNFSHRLRDLANRGKDVHITQKRELLPKTGRPLLSETTIPVYPLVSNFLEHSNKSFSIMFFFCQSKLAVEVGFKKGMESERCARKRQCRQ